jgi:hypothetical protein
MLRGGHDEDQVVDPGCDVDRVRQPSEEASHGANKAAERAPWQAANLKTKSSIKISLKSLSQPPRHVDGVQPFNTIASIHVTSWADPALAT